jgi:phosphoribosyl-ATP pyrophosphohydrolase/phosphoribosyl-AMP cyclohydrolase/histidinol dehydrogenase
VVYLPKFYSRYKGATSGATQEIISIRMDCNSNSLQFLVRQKGSGFCHIDSQRTCFGNGGGISELDRVLKERMETAPVGSYTKRLFDDEEMLKSSILFYS